MNILIVESKAKCKTLLKYLGKNDWRVLPTGGHIQHLPVDSKVHPPKEVKKAYWSHRPGELPSPPWFWTERGEAAVKAILDEAAKHESVTFFLASDPDREGELIAWHLDKLLPESAARHRITFDEITKPAVLSAVANPRPLDQSLIDAALIRTFMDRVVGWRASKIAGKYTSLFTNSMGRVQTPTLGFVVERELEREAHRPVRYFEVSARTSVVDLRVRFHEKDSPDAWVDEKGKFSAHRTADGLLAGSAHAALLRTLNVRVDDVTKRHKSQSPLPPFSTDTLLQAAGSRWGWSPKKTSALAGQLYEGGYLTYIRTDSTRLAEEAVKSGLEVIGDTWGEALLGPGVNTAAPAGAQDAHEAIRPTDLALASVPEAEADVQKLYALVRARTLASLMAPSQRVTLSVRAICEGLDRVLDGTVGWYAELGWRRAFEAKGLDETYETAECSISAETVLPLSPGDDERANPELREDETKPPARYKAHTLVKAMKEAGIGRPSTYSSTVERLEERAYVTNEDGTLAPTENGRNIWLMAAPLFTLDHGEEVFLAAYTANMEKALDLVANGESEASAVWEAMLNDFKEAHLRAQVASKGGSLTPGTRGKLEAYLEAAPEFADRIGDIDSLSEAEGQALLKEFRALGVVLLPTKKQKEYLARLLEANNLTMEQALDAAGVAFAGQDINKDEVSELIDYLSRLEGAKKAPSPKQLRWIADLAKKAGLDEASACELVGVSAFVELTGGKGGTASQLIELLLKTSRVPRRLPET